MSLDGRHVAMGSQDKNGTIVGVMVSTVTGAQEGVDTKLGDTYYRGGRWTPDGRSVATVDIRSGTPNLWSGFAGTCERSDEAVDPLYLGCGLGLRLVARR